MAKKGRIVQPGDGQTVQLGLFSAANTGDTRFIEDYPPVYRDEEGFRRVLAGATDMLGLDFEFNTKTLKPTVIGIANYDECAAVWYRPELAAEMEAERIRRGFVYSGHAVLTADRAVLEAQVGYTTPLSAWSDSMLTFWLANSDLCKNPGKETDEEGGLGFMGLGTMVSLTTDLPHHKTCRGRNCEELICPRHDVRGYCAIDAYGGLLGDRKCREDLRRRDVPESSITFLHKLTELSQRMSQMGVGVDHAYVETLAASMLKDQQKLFPDEGEDGFVFNPRSAKAVTEWGRENKVFFPSTDKGDVQTVLEKLAFEAGFSGEKFDEIQKALAAAEDEGKLDPVLSTVYKLYTYKILGKGTDPWFHPRYFGKDGRLHPRFVTTGTSTGRFSSSTPNVQNCLDAQTEILTSRGWVLFKDLTPADKVAQWWPTGNVEYVYPQEIIVQTYSGKMISVRNEHINLRMTAEHRCPLVDRKTGALRVYSAEDYPEDRKQIHSGRAVDFTSSDSWAYTRLLVAAQADGHLNGYGLCFRFTKRRKMERLREIVDELGLEYSYVDSNYRGDANLYIKTCETVRRIERDLGTPKILPRKLLSLPYARRRELIQEVCLWDGHWDKSKEYYSKHKENCDLVQELCAISGYRSIISYYENSTGGSCWIVRMTDRSYSLTTNSIREEEIVENETVYCVRVPSSYIIVRRNNRVCVTGNCPKRGWGKRVRKAFVPRDKDHVIVEADFSQLELRICLYLAGVDQKIIGADAFSWLVEKSGGLFEKAAQRYGGKPRDIAKSISHAADYLEGLRLYNATELDYTRTRSEIESGALRVYHPKYMPDLREAWSFRGKIVGFTGGNLAQRLFGSKSFENRRKALEIQEDIYFAAFPQIRHWQQKVLREVEDRGYVSSPAGRFLRLNDTPEKDAKVAIAFLGQGVGASHVQSVMLEYWRRHQQVFFAQIHDALCGEFPLSGGYRPIYTRMKEMEMETDLLPGFTCPCKVEVGTDWGSMKDLEEREGQLYLGGEPVE